MWNRYSSWALISLEALFTFFLITLQDSIESMHAFFKTLDKLFDFYLYCFLSFSVLSNSIPWMETDWSVSVVSLAITWFDLKNNTSVFWSSFVTITLIAKLQGLLYKEKYTRMLIIHGCPVMAPNRVILLAS